MSEIPEEFPEIDLSLDDLIPAPTPAPAPALDPAPAPAPAPTPAGVALADRFPDLPPLSAERLPPQFRKHVDPGAPLPLRGMAARGLVPLNPGDMAHCLAMLAVDADPKVAETARATIAKLPVQILSVALRDDSLSPRVLDTLAECLDPNLETIEGLLLNPAAHDLTLARLVERTREVKFVEIVAGNQLRLLREERLLRALLESPILARSLSDSISDFAVRSGVVMADVPQMAEAYVRVFGKPAPGAQQAAEEAQGETAEALMRELEQLSAASSAPGQGGDGEEDPQARMNLTKRILNMSMSQKIKLATLGNMEARTILLRDPNRLIQNAVINSPRITESEVLGLAQSKNPTDEILRIIMNRREWTRQYTLRLALVQNPRTPLTIAVRFLATLRELDVKKLAKNKNVPTGVQMQAKKMTKLK